MKTTTTATFEISSPAASCHLGAYEARDISQALYLFARDEGYKSFNQAVKRGAIALDELAISSNGRVWTWKAGAWTLADDRREVDPALLGE